MGIGERLREERARLGLTQPELGSKAGVAKQAQLRYEKGERVPDASYLQGAERAGVDVLYILTGRREQKPMSQSLAAGGMVAEQGGSYPAALELTDKERKLVTHFRKCSEGGQAALLQLAQELTK